MKKEYKIDATGRKLGRLATEISMILNGKTTVEYAPNVAPDIRVIVENASKMEIDAKKKKEKIYERYSGYQGGRKLISMKRVLATKGYSNTLEMAVYGMIPDNKLRSVKMNNLKIKE